ncbi:hypothetical protein Rhopal_003377-T1 [Rhodotorula paludigena]|uniref:PEBP-like protein n=1 Tax=Rhodotorula paludigena TaxID=86838 RepID=A0AAV5GCZ6_9BASI|nr:hypothetical protein Rhopal_003377-T1 [Rhodotorula paludigena]
MLAAALVSAALVGLVRAQDIPAVASPTDLALVSAQYENSGFSQGGNAGFGIELDAKAVLTVVYPFGAVENGASYTVDQVSEGPDLYVTPAESTVGWFNSSSRYTVALADASSLGDPDAEGNYRHFLANSLDGAAAEGDNLTFTPSNGQVITYYAAPGPIEGTGPHRYAWLLFEQPADFSAPSNLSTSGVNPSHWYVNSYVEETGLQLLAASFFTVSNGDATGSVAETQAVNTATLSAAPSATSGGSSTSAGSASETTSSGSPSASAAPDNGAAQLVLSVGAGALGVVGLAAAML